MPPLRDRRDDIPVLVEALVEQLLEVDDGLDRRTVPPEVVEELQSRPWPGNIRELRHSVHRYLVRGELTKPRTAHRIAAAASQLAIDDLLDMPYGQAAHEFEERFVLRALDLEQGNQLRAAKRIGINRSTLYRILQRRSEPKPSS